MNTLLIVVNTNYYITFSIIKSRTFNIIVTKELRDGCERR